MPVNDDASGDYGYDLAHELRSVLAMPLRRRPPLAPSGRMGRESDHDGDFGYDQAHES
ncbi:hypothetical protein [Pseudonocardia sp.]|uniref:hypothetical protein n=1 Tax=Pseudonocardia sp. TaxID=60912 RepID=UPI0026183611|nr:hypothetical protein [Pseudonocardia sp.]